MSKRVWFLWASTGYTRNKENENHIKVEIVKVSDRPFYSMEFHGDYCFDKYLSEDACDLAEFCAFIDKTLIGNAKKNVSPINFG